MRLVDADELLLRFIPRGGENNFTRFVRETVRLRLAEMPTVDAEPVVRCKDCKWYEIAELKRDGTDDKRYKPSVCVIGRYAKRRKADWFCADGERREDANY